MTEASPLPDWEDLGDRLAARSIADGDPTGWFDRLYAAGEAGEVSMPWSRRAPHPLLTPWSQGMDARGGRAIVVGCGLGADAEHVAALYYHTVAFDIAESAIRAARRRYPDSSVHYQTANPAWSADLPQSPRRDGLRPIGVTSGTCGDARPTASIQRRSIHKGARR